MADGSIAGIEPRTDPPTASFKQPITGQPGNQAASNSETVTAPSAAPADPLRALIDKLERTQPLVAKVEPGLAAAVRGIVERADQPGQLDEAMYRTRVAYALQDIEKLVGPVSGVPGDLRQEMKRLAGTSPGLRHEGMQALVASTIGIDDRALVRDIRKTAREIARSSDQGIADLDSKVDVLENRARISPRAPADRFDTTNWPFPQGGEPPPAGPDRDGSKQQIASGKPVGKSDTDANATRPKDDRGYANTTAAVQQRPAETVTQVQGVGAAFAVMAALRRPEPTNPEPWDSQLAPLAGRLAQYMDRNAARRDEEAMTKAEASGQAAVTALQNFAAGPGSSIMSKISAASKSNPEGMAGVVAGMHEGGAYADLRRGFNADLVRERGLVASLDSAAAAVGQYGKDRTSVDRIAGFQAEAATVASRFEKLDAAIGRSAAETPGAKDGKSLIDELGEKAAELARRAVDAVKAIFTRTPGAEQTASGPSPSAG